MKTSKLILIAVIGMSMLAGTAMSQSYSMVKDTKEIDRMHAMIVKSDYKMLKSYLKKGADVNEADEVGNTPLFFAAKIGDKRIVDLLVQHGANVNNTNEVGATPLMLAAKFGNIYTVKKLLEHGADPTIKNNSGYTAHVFAKAYENHEIAKMLEE